jgi:hypothetical protein
MNKLVKCIALGLIILVALSGMAAAESVVEGGINKAAGSLEVPRGTTVNGDVTVNMGEIVILGTVNGNVSGNMGQITIHGDVNGDVDANMGQVTIIGNVSGSVRARMGEVIVDGIVAGNVVADLGSVRIRGTVGGDVDTGLGELRIPGEVLGNVTSRGGNVYINGTVEGGVTLTRGIVDLGSQAVIGGRVYVEEGLVRSSNGASVGSIRVVTELTEEELLRLFRSRDGYTFYGLEKVIGDVSVSIERVFRDIRVPSMRYIFRDNTHYWMPFRPFGWPGHLARGLFNMIVLFALTALTYSLFPRQVQTAGKAVTDKSVTVFGWGLLAAVLAIPLMVLLAITIIGIPLIFVEILILAIAALLGYTAIAHLVGNRIVHTSSTKSANPLGAIALGVLIIGVVSMIPIVGWLASIIVFITAVGAVLTTRFGTVVPLPVETALPPGREEEPPVEDQQTDDSPLP